MSDEPDTRSMATLHDVLTREADRVQVSPHARADLERRLRARRRRPLHRRRWWTPVAVIAALGLVAVVGVLLVRDPWGRGAVPAPQAPPTSATPTSAVPGEDVMTTLVYYPGPGGHLVGEPVIRGTLEDVVARLSSGPADRSLVWAFGPLSLNSVSERGGTVIVDYVVDNRFRRARPDADTAALWSQSLVHTVATYLGRAVPVRVTFKGSAFSLFGRLDTAEPFTFQPVPTTVATSLLVTSKVPRGNAVLVLGTVGPDVGRVGLTVEAVKGRRVLTELTPTVTADRTFGLSVLTPPGTYLVRLVTQVGENSAPVSSEQRFEVA